MNIHEGFQDPATRPTELRSDIQSLRSIVQDSVAMGDSMFGQFAHVDISKQVTERNNELKQKKSELEKEIASKEAIVRRTNRDFSDVKDSLPETLPEKKIRFVEDYTMMFLMLSYVFALLSGIIFYVTLSEQKWVTFFKSLGASAFLTLLGGMLLYYLM